MKILADASIPGIASCFCKPFELETYEQFSNDLLTDVDILIIRSTQEISANTLSPKTLSVIATASSGSDHIDKDFLAQHNITLFDAKGCNAQSVADYVLCSMAYVSLAKLLLGKKVGIVGLGHTGQAVFKRLSKLGFELIVNDPIRQENEVQFESSPLSALFDCDVISLHVPLTTHTPHATQGLIDEHILSQLKPGCVLINTARGGVVDEDALLKFSHIRYCCDVYDNEPNIKPAVIELSTLCTPHIAGHSIEAKKRAGMQLSQQIHDFYDVPSQACQLPTHTVQTQGMSWEEQLLSLYDPMGETQILKSMASLTLAQQFTQLRKAHTIRHDFCYYQFPESSESTFLNQLLGHHD